MNNPKILFAEDDREDQFILTDAFREIGHAENICFVENGEEVLQYLSDLEPQLFPSLIVLDLNMPKMNGTETLRALKQNEAYKKINTIIFSTSVNEKEKSECMQLGAVSYITKPVKYNETINTARHFYDYVQ